MYHWRNREERLERIRLAKERIAARRYEGMWASEVVNWAASLREWSRRRSHRVRQFPEAVHIRPNERLAPPCPLARAFYFLRRRGTGVFVGAPHQSSSQVLAPKLRFVRADRANTWRTHRRESGMLRNINPSSTPAHSFKKHGGDLMKLGVERNTYCLSCDPSLRYLSEIITGPEGRDAVYLFVSVPTECSFCMVDAHVVAVEEIVVQFSAREHAHIVASQQSELAVSRRNHHLTLLTALEPSKPEKASLRARALVKHYARILDSRRVPLQVFVFPACLDAMPCCYRMRLVAQQSSLFYRAAVLEVDRTRGLHVVGRKRVARTTWSSDFLCSQQVQAEEHSDLVERVLPDLPPCGPLCDCDRCGGSVRQPDVDAVRASRRAQAESALRSPAVISFPSTAIPLPDRDRGQVGSTPVSRETFGFPIGGVVAASAARGSVERVLPSLPLRQEPASSSPFPPMPSLPPPPFPAPFAPPPSSPGLITGYASAQHADLGSSAGCVLPAPISPSASAFSQPAVPGYTRPASSRVSPWGELGSSPAIPSADAAYSRPVISFFEQPDVRAFVQAVSIKDEDAYTRGRVLDREVVIAFDATFAVRNLSAPPQPVLTVDFLRGVVPVDRKFPSQIVAGNAEKEYSLFTTALSTTGPVLSLSSNWEPRDPLAAWAALCARMDHAFVYSCQPDTKEYVARPDLHWSNVNFLTALEAAVFNPEQVRAAMTLPVPWEETVQGKYSYEAIQMCVEDSSTSWDKVDTRKITVKNEGVPKAKAPRSIVDEGLSRCLTESLLLTVFETLLFDKRALGLLSIKKQSAETSFAEWVSQCQRKLQHVDTTCWEIDQTGFEFHQQSWISADDDATPCGLLYLLTGLLSRIWAKMGDSLTFPMAAKTAETLEKVFNVDLKVSKSGAPNLYDITFKKAAFTARSARFFMTSGRRGTSSLNFLSELMVTLTAAFLDPEQLLYQDRLNPDLPIWFKCRYDTSRVAWWGKFEGDDGGGVVSRNFEKHTDKFCRSMQLMGLDAKFKTADGSPGHNRVEFIGIHSLVVDGKPSEHYTPDIPRTLTKSSYSTTTSRAPVFALWCRFVTYSVRFAAPCPPLSDLYWRLASCWDKKVETCIKPGTLIDTWLSNDDRRQLERWGPDPEETGAVKITREGLRQWAMHVMRTTRPSGRTHELFNMSCEAECSREEWVRFIDVCSGIDVEDDSTAVLAYMPKCLIRKFVANANLDSGPRGVYRTLAGLCA